MLPTPTIWGICKFRGALTWQRPTLKLGWRRPPIHSVTLFEVQLLPIGFSPRKIAETQFSGPWGISRIIFHLVVLAFFLTYRYQSPREVDHQLQYSWLK